MDILARASGGQNVVARAMRAPHWYAAPEAPAAYVRFWWTKDGEPAAAAKEVPGKFTPGAPFAFEFTPDRDCNVRLYEVSYSADDTPSVSRLEDAVQTALPFRRVTTAPTLSQVGEATADLVVIAADPPNRFIRKRRVRTSPNADMSDASATVREYGQDEAPRLVDISRIAGLVPTFVWSGGDPAASGFTKQGVGTTAASTSPAGWKITTGATDDLTYYMKDGWPAGAFDEGLTLEVVPPAVIASDGAGLPNDAVMARVEDGAKRYDLRFDTTSVYLNGGAGHAHGGARVRLVIAPGGAAADLWVGDTKVENDAAGVATTDAGLSFGDLAGEDDSQAVWPSIAYALTPQDVRLGRTIYVAVAHSGGETFAPESEPLEVTFASEGDAGGSSGSGDLVYRDKYNIDLE